LRGVLSDRTWKIESLLRLGMLVMMSISAGMLVVYLAARPLAGSLDLDLEFVAQVLGFLTMQGLAIVWVSMFLGEHGLTWADAFGFRRAPGHSLALATVTTVLALPIALFVIGGLVTLLYKAFGLTPEAQITVSFLKKDIPGWQLAIMGFTAIVLAPVAEEALFRGVLYTTLRQRGYHGLAYLGTSALFALIHFNIHAMLPLFFLSLVWTWLYERTGNLLAPIAAHVLFNAINFVAIVARLPEWLEKMFNQ
jgi:membrane protease YdiL (CAAX protease family)